jgi:uncharacterized protein YlbG (UPF0298 family)
MCYHNVSFVDFDGLDDHINTQIIIFCSHQKKKKNVNNYNKIVLKKNFSKYEMLHVTMDTNTTCVEHVVSQLNDLNFNHIHDVAIGTLIMF